MITIPFDGQQYARLEKLLQLPAGEPVTSDKLMAALEDAVELSLTLSHTSTRRRDPLVADAERRARAASIGHDVAGQRPGGISIRRPAGTP
jgi:hypothetical protein